MATSKLLVLDLDGTTFGCGTELPQSNRTRLEQARESGAVICFATGRRQLEPLAHMIPLADYIVLNNGGTAIAAASGEALFSHRIDRGEMCRLVDFCTQNEAVVHMLTEGYWGVNLITPQLAELERLHRSKAVLYHSTGELPFETIDGLIITGNCEAARLFIERERLGVECVYSEPGSMDVMPPGVNKWRAAAAIAAREGISTDDIIAAGNYYNDVEMIREAGVGVAVQNAPDEVKRYADYVTERTHTQGAVAEIVERFLL